MVRTASHLLGSDEPSALDWQALRGVREGIKTAEVAGVEEVAVCNGIASAQRLLETEGWRDEFVAIEVMACVGGYLGGGGEPKSADPQVLEKRMEAIYRLDRDQPHRRSHENQDVQQLYATELERPSSPRAHALLHTSYAPRHSKRLFLMRFLDCVDRRDGAAAARLFHPDASWSTASPLAEIRGVAEIEATIATRLPPRQYGPLFARHRMAASAETEGLEVLTPGGE